MSRNIPGILLLEICLSFRKKIMENNKQNSVYRFLNWVTSIGATCAWLIMAVLTFIDVVGRELFSTPIPGGYEIIQVLMAIGVFFSMPLVALHKGHVAVDILRQKFPPGLKSVTDGSAKIASIAFFGFLAYSLFILTMYAFSTGVRTSYLAIPHWAVGILMTFFLIITTVCCFVARDAVQTKTDGGSRRLTVWPGAGSGHALSP